MRKQVLSKISKKQKQQFESLISMLKPKVYITDSSNFKRLVQELTGSTRNSSAGFTPAMDPRVVPLQNVHDILPVYEYPCQYDQSSSDRSSVEVATPLVSNKSFPFDHYQNDGYPNPYRSNSVEVSNSMDAYPDSTVSSYNSNSTTDNKKYGFSSLQHREHDDRALEEYCPMYNKLENLFAYREIESFLLEDP